jgi:NAD(P)-dependent dehydrogenase (short-subunit alcohol dehydrogenase family)
MSLFSRGNRRAWSGPGKTWRMRVGAPSGRLGEASLPADVAGPDQAEAAAIETEKAFGPIDIWINNAMLSVLAPVKEITSEEFKRVMEVTFLGYI